MSQCESWLIFSLTCITPLCLSSRLLLSLFFSLSLLHCHPRLHLKGEKTTQKNALSVHLFLSSFHPPPLFLQQMSNYGHAHANASVYTQSFTSAEEKCVSALEMRSNQRYNSLPCHYCPLLTARVHLHACA